MFKTIYDTFIKAIKEKDVETVVYFLQNSSIESVYKVLQDNNDTIMEDTKTKIVLEDGESTIYVCNEVVYHYTKPIYYSKNEFITIRVTIPKITQHESLDNIRKFFINHPYIKFEDLDELGSLRLIRTGTIVTNYPPGFFPKKIIN